MDGHETTPLPHCWYEWESCPGAGGMACCQGRVRFAQMEAGPPPVSPHIYAQ